MSMIKRGHSEPTRPTVISSMKKCAMCGHVDNTSTICPKCEGAMVVVLVDNPPEEKPSGCNCVGRICRIDK